MGWVEFSEALVARNSVLAPAIVVTDSGGARWNRSLVESLSLPEGGTNFRVWVDRERGLFGFTLCADGPYPAHPTQRNRVHCPVVLKLLSLECGYVVE